MTTEEAIKKAVDVGWRPKAVWKGWKRIDILTEISEGNLYQDPSFWQSLGKALGWYAPDNFNKYGEWFIRWHRFIDHLAEGKTADSFFTSLDI